MITELYVDGGIIGKNPSPIGGTWVYRIIGADGSISGNSGVITPGQMEGEVVTNNQSEMVALLMGLLALPSYFCGTVYSDSDVTLGRVFRQYQWKNIPVWVHRLYQEQRSRLILWPKISHILLDGHPSKEELRVGIGKRGHMVSDHNVWCDRACREVGSRYVSGMPFQISLSALNKQKE